MQKKEISGRDLLLSFLYSPGVDNKTNEKIVGRTKIQKMMFLFEEQIYPNFFKDSLQISLPEFNPYYFGPFSKELYDYLSFFLSIGMIKSDATSIPLSKADSIENFDLENDNPDVSFEIDCDNSDKYEREYFLSDIGVHYVEENIWDKFSDAQKLKLKEFKCKINQLSLDSLLSYVYNKYPEETINSVIAKKYLK
ncbi:MAG: hypothetical protein VZQ61_03465 [Christensenellaceae bacterium]